MSLSRVTRAVFVVGLLLNGLSWASAQQPRPQVPPPDPAGPIVEAISYELPPTTTVGETWSLKVTVRNNTSGSLPIRAALIVQGDHAKLLSAKAPVQQIAGNSTYTFIFSFKTVKVGESTYWCDVAPVGR
jgi:hypothetical protein